MKRHQGHHFSNCVSNFAVVAIKDKKLWVANTWYWLIVLYVWHFHMWQGQPHPTNHWMHLQGQRQVWDQLGQAKPGKMLTFVVKQPVGWRRKGWASVTPAFREWGPAYHFPLPDQGAVRISRELGQELGQPCPSTAALTAGVQAWF